VISGLSYIPDSSAKLYVPASKAFTNHKLYIMKKLVQDRKLTVFKVAMEVPVNGEIGDEVHLVDQILLFTSGRGLATVNGKDQEVKAGDVVVVPAGTQHQFVTKGDEPLEVSQRCED
jgi:mannose-6-phosphate isomerase-like protein (cupin superfamily)